MTLDLTVLLPLGLGIFSLFAFMPPYKTEQGEQATPMRYRVGFFLLFAGPAFVLCILNGHFGWSPME